MIDCADSAEVSEEHLGRCCSQSQYICSGCIDFDVSQYFGITSTNFNCINAFCCSHVLLPKRSLGWQTGARGSIEDELKRYMLNWCVNDLMQWWSDHEAIKLPSHCSVSPAKVLIYPFRCPVLTLKGYFLS